MSANVVARNAGSSTFVLMAVCFVVGPIEPAMNRGRFGVRSLNSCTAARAHATAAALISAASSTGSSNSSIPTGLAPNVFVVTMSAPASR
jgi:hypothetical protein